MRSSSNVVRYGSIVRLKIARSKSATINRLSCHVLEDVGLMYEYFFSAFTRDRRRVSAEMPDVYKHLSEYALLFYRYVLYAEIGVGFKIQLVLLPAKISSVDSPATARVRVVIGPYYIEWTPNSLTYPRPILKRFFRRSLAVITLASHFDPTKENWLKICSMLVDFNKSYRFLFNDFDYDILHETVYATADDLPKSIVSDVLRIPWPINNLTYLEGFVDYCSRSNNHPHSMIILSHSFDSHQSLHEFKFKNNNQSHTEKTLGQMMSGMDKLLEAFDSAFWIRNAYEETNELTMFSPRKIIPRIIWDKHNSFVRDYSTILPILPDVIWIIIRNYILINVVIPEQENN